MLTLDNSGNMYNANRPTNAIFQLFPLFSSSNTKDIDSVRKRIPGGGRMNITFASSATNTLTSTIGSGSHTISRLFMDENAISTYDGLSIRI